jgi:hypothetical protein
VGESENKRIWVRMRVRVRECVRKNVGENESVGVRKCVYEWEGIREEGGIEKEQREVIQGIISFHQHRALA